MKYSLLINLLYYLSLTVGYPVFSINRIYGNRHSTVTGYPVKSLSGSSPTDTLLLGIASSCRPKGRSFGRVCWRAIFNKMARKLSALNRFVVTYDTMFQW